jgi:hypothetical protein
MNSGTRPDSTGYNKDRPRPIGTGREPVVLPGGSRIQTLVGVRRRIYRPLLLAGRHRWTLVSLSAYPSLLTRLDNRGQIPHQGCIGGGRSGPAPLPILQRPRRETRGGSNIWDRGCFLSPKISSEIAKKTSSGLGR